MALDYLENEPSPIKFLKKSRTMMMSWAVTGWAVHKVFTKPATKVVVQSCDEPRAVNCVHYAKALWRHSLPSLREHWQLEKGLEKQPDHELTMATGSSFTAIPSGADRIRSVHPTIVILDEAAFIAEGEASYNVAVATSCLHLIVLSSANPGFFEDVCQRARPTEWPFGIPQAA